MKNALKMNNYPAFPDNYPEFSLKMGKRSFIRAPMAYAPGTPLKMSPRRGEKRGSAENLFSIGACFLFSVCFGYSRRIEQRPILADLDKTHTNDPDEPEVPGVVARPNLAGAAGSLRDLRKPAKTVTGLDGNILSQLVELPGSGPIPVRSELPLSQLGTDNILIYPAKHPHSLIYQREDPWQNRKKKRQDALRREYWRTPWS
jgi:hypothetical protein